MASEAIEKTWLEKTRSSPKMVLFVASFALFVEEVLYGMVGPLIPDCPAGIKDEHVISILYGAYALGLIVATPILGIVTDRLGRKQPMLLGAAVLTISALLFANGSSNQIMYIGRVLEGIGAACTWTAGMALVAEYFTKDRVKAMGFAMFGATTGSIVGPLLGGELFDWMGYTPTFYLAFAALAISTVLTYFFLAPSVPQNSGPWSKTFVEIRGIISDRSVLTAAMAVALAAASWALMEPLFPIHVMKVGHASTATVGVLVTISNLLYAFLAPLVGFVSDRFGVRQTAALGLLMTALVLPLLALSPNIFAATVVLCLITVSYAFTINPTSAELGDAVDRRGSSSYAIAYAVYNLAYSLGMIAVDAYIEFVTDDSHKLELFQILAIMSVMFLICIPIFTMKHKSESNENSAVPAKETVPVLADSAEEAVKENE